MADSNPKVRSTFDRAHGKGLKAPHLSWPGATAPVTGTQVPGFDANGNMRPKPSGLKVTGPKGK